MTGDGYIIANIQILKKTTNQNDKLLVMFPFFYRHGNKSVTHS